MEMLKEKIKSPVMWATLAALIAFVCKNWLGFEIPGWDEFIELLLAFFVAVGVVNNPNSRDSI